MKKQTCKKLLSALTAAALSTLLLTGCNQNPADSSTSPTDSSASDPAFSQAGDSTAVPAGFTTPEQFIQDIQPHLDCLASCDQELYGADVDWDTVLHAGYVSENDSTVGVLYPADAPLPEGFVEDPGFASYYPIRNFTSMEEVRFWLEQYITPEALEQLGVDLDRNVLLEFDGMLYLCRGGRGYGTFSMDLTTLQYLGEENGQQIVSIDLFAFSEYDHTRKLYFSPADEGWRLARVEVITNAVG